MAEHQENEPYTGLAEVDGGLAVLRMKMDAMTWAAKTKDAELATLQAALREGRERERRLEAELAGLASRLERAEVAEERLAAEIAELEADAFQRARTHKLQMDSLNEALREKDKLLAKAAGQLSLFGSGKGKEQAGAQQQAADGDSERPPPSKRGTPLRRSPVRYYGPRSPARSTTGNVPAVKLSSSWWPWARKPNYPASQPPDTPPRTAKLPKHLLSQSSSASSTLHTPLTIS